MIGAPLSEGRGLLIRASTRGRGSWVLIDISQAEADQDCVPAQSPSLVLLGLEEDWACSRVLPPLGKNSRRENGQLAGALPEPSQP